LSTAMPPKVLFLAGAGRGGDARPPWPGLHNPFDGEVDATGRWVAWRLVGANHRELGRSTVVFPTLDRARAAVGMLAVRIADLDGQVRTGAPGGAWTWRVALDDLPVATSSRSYSRQREAAYNIAAFLAAVPLARLATTVVGSSRPDRGARSGPVVNVRCTPDDQLPHVSEAASESAVCPLPSR